MSIEERSKISHQIMAQIYKAVEKIVPKGAIDLLCLLGSYGDTQEDEDILEMLIQYNDTGSYMDEIIESRLTNDFVKAKVTDLVEESIAQPDHKPGGSTPSQYALPPEATDLQDLIEHREVNFALGNIFKAAYRMGNCEHSDPLRDARKIEYFAGRLVEQLEKTEAKE